MKILAALIALALAGCAATPAQPALVKPTSSGFAEGTFRNTTIVAVQSKFAANCVAQGRTVEDVNALQISCGHDILGVRAETWHAITTWTLVQTGTDVHASAGAAVRFQNGNREQIRGRNDVTNKMQSTMFQLGAE